PTLSFLAGALVGGIFWMGVKAAAELFVRLSSALMSIHADVILAIALWLALPFFLLCFGLLGGGLRLVWLAVKELPKNSFGLCSGMQNDPSEGEALTGWLHARINEVAGRKATDAPLTFGVLREDAVGV